MIAAFQLHARPRLGAAAGSREHEPMHDEASYTCDRCGEEIIVPVDLSAGRDQTYVEDCPVCCHPHVIHVHVDAEDDVRLWGDAE
jgi:hypothetical protein